MKSVCAVAVVNVYIYECCIAGIWIEKKSDPVWIRKSTKCHFLYSLFLFFYIDMSHCEWAVCGHEGFLVLFTLLYFVRREIKNTKSDI